MPPTISEQSNSSAVSSASDNDPNNNQNSGFFQSSFGKFVLWPLVVFALIGWVAAIFLFIKLKKSQGAAPNDAANADQVDNSPPNDANDNNFESEDEPLEREEIFI